MFSVLLTTVLLSSFLFQLAYAYDNNEYGFSITPPTGWTIEEQTGLIAVMFVDTGASINVVVEETHGTLSPYIAATKLQLATTFDNYVLISEGSRVIGGLDCYSIISTWTQLGYDFKAQQVIFVELGKAFVITCGAFESQYVNYILDFENSLASFRITGASQQATTLDNNNLIIMAIIVVAVVVIAIAALFLLRKKSRVSEPPSQTTPISPSPYIPPTNRGGDTAARLENLQRLLDNNIITKEEYEKKRSEILAQV